MNVYHTSVSPLQLSTILLEPYKFVRLQRHSPFGMLQDIVETALHDLCIALGILHVAGLKVFVFGNDSVIVGVLGGLFEDALQLIASLDLGVAFGRTCYPVDAVDYRMGAVCLHCQFVTVLVQKVDQLSVYLKRRFTAGDNDEALGIRLYPIEYIFVAHLLVLCKIGVAERTLQVATSKTNEYRSTSCVAPFALQ